MIKRRTAIVLGQSPYEIEAADPNDAARAMAAIEGALAPAPEADLITWIGELYIRTGHEKHDPKTRVALIRLYVRELLPFPGALVERTIRSYRGDMFPPLDRLRLPIECSPEHIRMREILMALRRYLVNGPEPVGKAISPEERERVSAGFSELLKNLTSTGPPGGSGKQTGRRRARGGSAKKPHRRPSETETETPDA